MRRAGLILTAVASIYLQHCTQPKNRDVTPRYTAVTVDAYVCEKFDEDIIMTKNGDVEVVKHIGPGGLAYLFLVYDEDVAVIANQEWIFPSDYDGTLAPDIAERYINIQDCVVKMEVKYRKKF